MKYEVVTKETGKGLVNVETKEIALECKYDSIERLDNGCYSVKVKESESVDNVILNPNLVKTILNPNLEEVITLDVMNHVQVINEKYLLIVKFETKNTSLVLNVETKEVEFTLEGYASTEIVAGDKFVISVKKLSEKKVAYDVLIFQPVQGKLKLWKSMSALNTGSVILSRTRDREIIFVSERNEDPASSKLGCVQYRLIYKEDGEFIISGSVDDIITFSSGVDRFITIKDDVHCVCDAKLNVIHKLENMKRPGIENPVKNKVTTGIFAKDVCTLRDNDGNQYLYSSIADTIKKHDVKDYHNNFAIVRESNSERVYNLVANEFISGGYDEVEYLTWKIDDIIDTTNYDLNSEEDRDLVYDIDSMLRHWHIFPYVYKVRKGEKMQVVAIAEKENALELVVLHEELDEAKSKEVLLIPTVGQSFIFIKDGGQLRPVSIVAEKPVDAHELDMKDSPKNPKDYPTYKYSFTHDEIIYTLHGDVDFKSFKVDGDIKAETILDIYHHLTRDGVIRLLDEVVPVL